MAIATINGIPVFNATLEAEECGIYRISLVDAPAVESNFVAYGKKGEMQKYSVLNDEKRRCVALFFVPISRYTA